MIYSTDHGTPSRESSSWLCSISMTREVTARTLWKSSQGSRMGSGFRDLTLRTLLQSAKGQVLVADNNQMVMEVVTVLNARKRSRTV